MQISYDSNRKILGLSLMPWTILGPEQWFNNYSIASMYGWDVTSSKAKVYPLFSENPQQGNAPRLNLQSLIEDPRYLSLLGNELKDEDILITRPLKIPEQLSGRKLLMLDSSLAKTFENKASCREQFKDELPFPEHVVYELDDLEPAQMSYDMIMNGRSSVILQGDSSSGSKGTYLISDLEAFIEAITSLKATRSTRAVVSEFIANAAELSVQCCITRYGVYVGPLQRQIMASPDLCNPEFKSREKFCGGIIDETDNSSQEYSQVRQVTQLVADRLKVSGYRGIFGIDFLQDENGSLYVLEINARQTGLTPLLTGLELPFLLLNILELGDYDYKVTDPSLSLKNSGALLLLHSKVNERKTVDKLPRSGTYEIKDSQLVVVSDSIELSKIETNQFVLQAYYLPGMTVIPSGRLVSLQFKRQVMDKNSKVLYNEIKETISTVERNILLK
jgi:hypothetical protein